MSRLKSNLVSVYLLREGDGGGSGLQVLLLQRPPEHLFPGDWQGVHGHIEAGETAWQAALRELREETAVEPQCWYRLVRVGSFYVPENDTIYLVPSFLAVAPPAAAFRLSSEHQAGLWCPLGEARDRFSWVTQRDALEDIIAATRCWPRTGPELTPMDVDELQRTRSQPRHGPR